MKVGEFHKVTSGIFSGLEVKIVGITSTNYKVQLQNDFTAPCTCCDSGDDCGNGDFYESGEFVTMRKACIEPESTVLMRSIQRTAMDLRGLLLKKKMLDNPIEGEKEIKKLLECIEL